MALLSQDAAGRHISIENVYIYSFGTCAVYRMFVSRLGNAVFRDAGEILPIWCWTYQPKVYASSGHDERGRGRFECHLMLDALMRDSAAAGAARTVGRHGCRR